MSIATPERRTAMYHVQLAMGAVMADADGWQLPVHYGDASREAAWLRETVGVSDVSPIGKVRVVGEDAAQMVNSLLPEAGELPTGSVSEADSPSRTRRQAAGRQAVPRRILGPDSRWRGSPRGKCDAVRPLELRLRH